MPIAAIIAAVTDAGHFVGSVVPRSHHAVGMPSATALASENARKTRVRMSRGARSQPATPTMT